MNFSRNSLACLGPLALLLWGTACVSFSAYKSLESKLESQRQENAKLKLQVEKGSQKLGAIYSERDALSASRALTEQERLEYADIIEKLKNSVNVGRFNLRISGGRVVLILPADILFESGSAVISKRGSGVIKELTHILKNNPNCKYQIEGHTDDIPIHTPRFPSNWELASERALRVLHSMVAAGMPPVLLSSASFADTRPIKSNEEKEGRQANRRIEIALIPDLSALPLKKTEVSAE